LCSVAHYGPEKNRPALDRVSPPGPDREECCDQRLQDEAKVQRARLACEQFVPAASEQLFHWQPTGQLDNSNSDNLPYTLAEHNKNERLAKQCSFMSNFLLKNSAFA
jgi:hypothetical protein